MRKITLNVESIRHITHDVLQIDVEKLVPFSFNPGKATGISINKEGLHDKTGPVTFTSSSKEKHLQFLIKTYPSHKGITNELLHLKKNDELILHDVFGAIARTRAWAFLSPAARVLRHVSPNSGIFSQRMKSEPTGSFSPTRQKAISFWRMSSLHY